MEYFLIYLLQIADLIRFLSLPFFIFFVLSLVAIIVATFIKYLDPDSELRELSSDFQKFNFKVFLVSLIFLIILGLIPCKQTIVLCAGVHFGKKTVETVVNSDKMEKINTIIDLQLDKYIKDFQQSIGENNGK